MAKFKKGDKVIRQDGRHFSNGNIVATVEWIETRRTGGDYIWLEETGKRIRETQLELVKSEDTVLKAIEDKITELRLKKHDIEIEIQKLDDAWTIVKSI